MLYHLHSTPAVEGNLTDIEAFTQGLDEFFDVAVVDNITLRGLKVTLPLPHILWYMVTQDSKVEIVLRYPEVRQNDVFVIFIKRRKHQYKSRNIRGGG